jgi:formylglycine-generating enzyme required for sulfatase activity
MRSWRWGLVGLFFGVVAWPILLYGAIFELQNGERLVGEVSAPLTIAVTLTGTLEVPPQELVSIEGERFALADGTVVKGRIAAEVVVVNTSSGRVLQLPVAQLRTMRRGKEAVTTSSTSGNIFELDDGEVLVGEPGVPLIIQLPFGGKLEVPPRELVLFANGRFTLRDGSLLKGHLMPESLLVTTRFGTLQVPSAALKTIRTAQVVGASGVYSGTEAVQPELPGRPFSSGSAPAGITFVNSLGMTFVLLPAGKFMMGSKDGEYDEKPVHKVRISQPFYLGQYEVTQGQWQAVMGNNPSHFTGDPTLPVEQVSWEDVQAFIRRLNTREGGTAYRLPTEAEWEYAVRAGSTTAYSFGDDASRLEAYAWYGENAAGRTHPVGQRQPNAWGLYDMHGNVWEWVQDGYGPYDVDVVTDPRGATAHVYRVYRGGGWGTFPANCRSSDRNYDAPDARLTGLGFRLLRAVQ